MIDLVVVLLVVGGATLAIALLPSRKEVIGLAGAAAAMIYGHLRGFFPVERAFAAVSMPVILILLAIDLFGQVFAASGVFERLCRRLAILVGGSRPALVVVFLALSYVVSLFLNNLTCLLVLLPIMVGAMRALGMGAGELRATTVAIVIASNLGGASTMIGDFPNILIARSQNIPFVEFLHWMTPPCVVLLGVLVYFARLPREAAPEPLSRELLVEMIAQQAERLHVDRRLFIPSCATFLLLIALLVATGWWPFPPELIAVGLAIACLCMLPRAEVWIARVDVRSLLFIACLFIFAGAIQATGVLDRAAHGVVSLTGGNRYYLSASVILLACVLTAVFSAGPTTAALIPAAAAMQSQLPGHMIWWCLSLGVLAGSSATLLSATAGPIAANVLQAKAGVELRYGDFLRLGWKCALSFSAVAIGYVWLRL